MSSQKGYMQGYSSPQVGHHEWRTAENSAQFLLPHLQRMAKEKPELKLLDVGAGSGTITASFAKYMPQGDITGTDISEEILEQARQYAGSKGIRNINFSQANVYKLPFEDDCFDVSHESQVLVHLENPVDAIREIIRVTKPGGVVALRDADMKSMGSFFYPEIPAMTHFYQVYNKALIAGGGSETAGRELLSWTLKAGVARENIEASFGAWYYSTNQERATFSRPMISRLKEGAAGQRIREMGLATEDEITAMVQAWEEWTETEDATMACPSGEIIIHKL